MGLKKAQEKEYARVLFVSENLSQKEIADRVGVTEKTIGKWIAEGGWLKLKRSLLTTRKNQLDMWYEQLDVLNTHIKTRKIIYNIPAHLLVPIKTVRPDGTIIEEYPEYDETEYPILIGNFATPAEADTQSKTTTNIKKLEVETSIAEAYEVGSAFIEFVRGNDLALAQKITGLFDLFINTKIK